MQGWAGSGTADGREARCSGGVWASTVSGGADQKSSSHVVLPFQPVRPQGWPATQTQNLPTSSTSPSQRGSSHRPTAPTLFLTHPPQPDTSLGPQTSSSQRTAKAGSQRLLGTGSVQRLAGRVGMCTVTWTAGPWSRVCLHLLVQIISDVNLTKQSELQYHTISFLFYFYFIF